MLHINLPPGTIPYIIFLIAIINLNSYCIIFTGIDERLVELKNEMDIVSELSSKMIAENMHKLQSQEEYTKKYEELLKR